LTKTVFAIDRLTRTVFGEQLDSLYDFFFYGLLQTLWNESDM
jgi:hypothetical protein